ncbi:MAG: single-stranded DNA-binding protein, partial [Planctomycetota bacterium]
MPNYNRVILMGNLTRDPELRYTPSGTAVADFGLAVNRRRRGSDGERRDETCFVDVTAWGRQAEIINEHFTKGRPIFFEGRLQLDEWTSSDGQRRSKLKVVLERFQFITPKDAPMGRRPQRQD